MNSNHVLLRHFQATGIDDQLTAYIQRIRDERELAKREAASANQDEQQTQYKCPTCGSFNIVTEFVQERRGDEMAQLVLKCVCGYKWKEGKT